jgi:hypothetical protein
MPIARSDSSRFKQKRRALPGVFVLTGGIATLRDVMPHAPSY